VSARIYALCILALVSAVLLMVTLTSGATFTAPTTNPANQIGTATLGAPTGVSAAVQSDATTVRVAWTATSSLWASGHRIYRATSAGGPYSLIQQIAGRATVTYDDVPGAGAFFYVIRGYYNTGGANWESGDSAQVSAKPLNNFTLDAIATQHSGVAFTLTVVARAQDGSVMTGFAGTVTFSVSSGSVNPATSNAFSGGSVTQNVTITGPYSTTETVTATGSSRTGTSAAFTLNHFHATAIGLTNLGTTTGRIQNGDTIAITFSEAATTTSLGTCDGAANSGNDLALNDVNPDTLTANGLALAFGTITLGNAGYVAAADVAKNSTCAWTAGNTVLTVTLAGVVPVRTATVAGGSTATFLPNAAITSATGEPIDTAQVPSLTGILF
jgi:hypothetical protein